MPKKARGDFRQEPIPGTEMEAEEEETPPVFPDERNLRLQGIDDERIAAVRKVFRQCVKRKVDLDQAKKALEDELETLYETMEENKVPTYGERSAGANWIATIETKIKVKLAKNK